MARFQLENTDNGAKFEIEGETPLRVTPAIAPPGTYYVRALSVVAEDLLYVGALEAGAFTLNLDSAALLRIYAVVATAGTFTVSGADVPQEDYMILLPNGDPTNPDFLTTEGGDLLVLEGL